MLRKSYARNLKELAIIVCIALAFSEIILQWLLRANILKIHGVLQHPNITREFFDDYLKSRDPLLGWPSKLAHGKLFNDKGYRPSPENNKYPDTDACVSVFGDSQGYGLDVTDKQAWTNILAEKLKCKVENYSVPAYGTDQALLRFQKIKPKSEAVILTFIDDNLRRNLLQYWDLAYGPIYLERTKPRFVLDGRGELQSIRLPIDTYEQVQQLNRWRFHDLFQYETFAPSSPLYKTAFQPGFPYTLSLASKSISNAVTKSSNSPLISATPLKLLVDKREDPGQSITKPSTLLLHRAILRRFAEVCTASRYRCFILRLQPNFVQPQQEYADVIRKYLENDSKLKPLYLSGLAMAPCIHKRLIAQLGTSTNLDRRMPGGHYGPETNQAIGECVAMQLKGKLG